MRGGLPGAGQAYLHIRTATLDPYAVDQVGMTGTVSCSQGGAGPITDSCRLEVYCFSALPLMMTSGVVEIKRASFP